MATCSPAPHNRTLRLDEQQAAGYLTRCLTDIPADAAALQNATIMGDSFSLLPRLPSGFVDLLIADPPYNLQKTFGQNRFEKMSGQQYEEYTRRWLGALRHTLKPTASLYICCDWRTSLLIAPLLQEFFTLRNRITWQREKGRGAKANWKNSMEDIWFATVSNQYTFNLDAVKQRRRVLAPYRQDGQPKDWQQTQDGRFRDSHPSNFWDDISVPYWSMPENTQHPTQKPEKLMAKLILASSNPGDLVFDPFAGVGSSAVAAKKLGRQYLAIELEPEYCALTQKRLELAETHRNIQGYAGGVFWERNSLSDQRLFAVETDT